MSSHHLRGPVVVLQGSALVSARHLLALGIQTLRQRDGIMPPAALLELSRQLTSAAEEYLAGSVPQSGHGQVRNAAGRAESEPLTTREVAAVLKVSTRHVRRLPLARVSGEGRRLLFDPDHVEAYAADRAERLAS